MSSSSVPWPPQGTLLKCLFNYTAVNDQELTVAQGEPLYVEEATPGRDWWLVSNACGGKGFLSRALVSVAKGSCWVCRCPVYDVEERTKTRSNCKVGFSYAHFLCGQPQPQQPSQPGKHTARAAGSFTSTITMATVSGASTSSGSASESGSDFSAPDMYINVRRPPCPQPKPRPRPRPHHSQMGDAKAVPVWRVPGQKAAYTHEDQAKDGGPTEECPVCLEPVRVLKDNFCRHCGSPQIQHQHQHQPPRPTLRPTRCAPPQPRRPPLQPPRRKTLDHRSGNAQSHTHQHLPRQEDLRWPVSPPPGAARLYSG